VNHEASRSGATDALPPLQPRSELSSWQLQLTFLQFQASSSSRSTLPASSSMRAL